MTGKREDQWLTDDEVPPPEPTIDGSVSYGFGPNRGPGIHGPVDGIIIRDPGPGHIAVWNADPVSPTYGHVEILTRAQASAYRRAARRTGRRRRIQQLVRLIRRTP
jgi:hypothetical protein